ncbi:MAG TPA: hypothetical protein VN081_02215 [Dongiaceae bacterium]|nr:hypothetical protein [Dongiaceae bacterium]
MADKKYDITNLKSTWEAESAYVKVFTQDFPDLDRLVDAVSVQNDPKNPNMADTTTASSVRSLPKKSLKQMPVFSVEVNGSKYNMEAIMINYLLKDVVFNDDTFGKGVLSTLQLAMIQAVTHGFATMFVAKSKLYDDFGTVLRLINYNDFGVERGIQDGNQTGHDFIRTNIPRSRFEAILDDIKENPEANTSYNAAVIEDLLKLSPDGENYAGQSIESNQKQTNAPTDSYQVITYHNYKKSGNTVLFNPQQQEPFQVLPNKSKFSYPRLIMLVIDPAPLNPFGLSRVRLASPNQNFLNALRQNVGYTWLYNSSPALLQLGQFATAVSLKRNALIKSTDYQANVKPILLDTSTSQQYPTISRDVQQQIIDIIAGTASALGAIGQSKTGVGAQTQKENLDDNTMQLTNLAENTLRQYALVAIDVILSETEGEDDIIVDDETKARLNELEPGSVGNDNTVHNFSWSALYDEVKKLRVEIDVSVGKQEADQAKEEALTAALANATQNADPNNPADQQFKNEIMDEYRKTVLPDKSVNTPLPVNTPEPEAPNMPQLPQAEVPQIPNMGIPQ